MVAPLHYNPSTGEVYLYKYMRFKISTEPKTIEINPAFIEEVLNPGENLVTTITTTNVGQAEIPQIEIQCVGNVKEYLNLSPTEIQKLEVGESQEVIVALAVPEDLPPRSYIGEIRLKIAGKIKPNKL